MIDMLDPEFGRFDGRIYFDIAEVDDELLRDCLTMRQVAKSSAYIEDLAEGYGVGRERILDPAPFKIQQIAEAYALMETAKTRSMMNGSGDSEGADAYELKRKVYAREVEELIDQITADTFTGGKTARKRAFPMTMEMHRR